MTPAGGEAARLTLVRKALLDADMLMHDLLAVPAFAERARALHDLVHDASYQLARGDMPPEGEAWMTREARAAVVEAEGR